MSFISNLSGGYLQSVFGAALRRSGSTAGSTSNTVTDTETAAAQTADNRHLSPFAKLLSTLQQLQQTDSAKYQEVTQQIAANLQTASDKAGTDGNTAAHSQLKQLSTDFTNASTSGQLPNIQDLAQALGGQHPHHRHHYHAAADTSDNSTASTASSASTDQGSAQLLSALRANGTQSEWQNPMTIIRETLAKAGIRDSTSGN